MLTHEQLIERREYIGASDVAAILGVNPWKSAWDVWRDKRGLSEPVDPTPAMLAGTFLESGVLHYYNHTMGVAAVACHRYTDPVRPWLQVLPDGELRDADGNLTAILEIKCSSQWSDDGWGEPWDGVSEDHTPEVPPHYLWQVMAQLHVTGAPECHVVRLKAFGEPLQIYRVRPNLAAIDGMLRRLDRWHAEHIVGGMEPPRTSAVFVEPDTSRDLVVAPDDSEEATLLARFAELHAAIAEHNEATKPLESELKTIKGRLSVLSGESPGYVHNGVQFKRSGTTSVSYQKVAAALAGGKIPADVVARFTTKSNKWSIKR
jgi:putative phage-type endonuclease